MAVIEEPCVIAGDSCAGVWCPLIVARESAASSRASLSSKSEVVDEVDRGAEAASNLANLSSLSRSAASLSLSSSSLCFRASSFSLLADRIELAGDPIFATSLLGGTGPPRPGLALFTGEKNRSCSILASVGDIGESEPPSPLVVRANGWEGGSVEVGMGNSSPGTGFLFWDNEVLRLGISVMRIVGAYDSLVWEMFWVLMAVVERSEYVEGGDIVDGAGVYGFLYTPQR